MQDRAQLAHEKRACTPHMAAQMHGCAPTHRPELAHKHTPQHVEESQQCSALAGGGAGSKWSKK